MKIKFDFDFLCPLIMLYHKGQEKSRTFSINIKNFFHIIEHIPLAVMAGINKYVGEWI